MEAATKDQSQTTKTPKKWSLKKKLAVIGGGIIIFIIGLVAIVNSATSAPLKVSDDFISAIRNENSTSAYSLFSSEAKQVVDADDFKLVVDQIGPILSGLPEVQSKEVSAETGSDATAKIVYKIKGSDGLTYLLTVNLINENSEWKVINFDSEAE